MNLDDDIHELYAGDFASFVTRRDAMAKRLRDDGNRDDATTVKALRKPEKLAGELDHAVAENPEAMAALVTAAAKAAAAQSKGGDVRGATTALRDAVRTLASATADPAAATIALIAVVANPDALEELRAGRLVAVPEGGGFGPLPEGPAPARAARPKDDSKRREAEAALDAAEAAYGEAVATHAVVKAAERDADERVKAAKRDVDAAKKALTRLR